MSYNHDFNISVVTIQIRFVLIVVRRGTDRVSCPFWSFLSDRFRCGFNTLLFNIIKLSKFKNIALCVEYEVGRSKAVWLDNEYASKSLFRSLLVRTHESSSYAPAAVPCLIWRWLVIPRKFVDENGMWLIFTSKSWIVRRLWWCLTPLVNLVARERATATKKVRVVKKKICIRLWSRQSRRADTRSLAR